MTDQLRQAAQQALVAYDKTAMNSFVQNLYDEKMQEGKHGHYETMFHVVHEAVKRFAPPQQQAEPMVDCPRCGHVCSQRPWVDLTDNDWGWVADRKGTSLDTFDQGAAWAQARLQERNT